MNKIFFTKKHFLMSVVCALLLVFMSMGIYLLLIAPQKKALAQFSAEAATLKTDTEEAEKEYRELQQYPSLLETEIFKEKPVITNGLEIENYFRELLAIQESTNVSVQRLSFEHGTIFPELVMEEGNGAEKQVQRTTITFDVLGNSEQEILSLIQKLETEYRFTKMEMLIYRANPEALGTGNFGFSTSFSLHIYYLSLYETGKSVQ